MAKDKCPECGGSKRGRGYTHKEGCSEASKGAAKKPRGDILDLIDGRTKTATLLRLQEKIEAILSEKDKGEVKKVKEALANVEKLREQLAEAESLL